jgi:hypothetical protein
MEYYSSMGGGLNITDSNIAAISDTVNWVHVNASRCSNGEFFGATRGVCLKCLPSTYSLQAPTDTCLPCPANAQVGFSCRRNAVTHHSSIYSVTEHQHCCTGVEYSTSAAHYATYVA